MRIGIFADAHDHVDNVRCAVSEFNRRGCELVLFAGDLVSPMVVVPLRKLRCPLIGCFGDNDGNKVGIQGGMRVVGVLGEPPFGVIAADGTRILLTHIAVTDRRNASVTNVGESVDFADGFDVIISAHTHRARIQNDAAGRLHINPGETSGWTYREPSIALLETGSLSAEIVRLPDLPPLPDGWERSPQRSEVG